jgi:hypothetical protein
MIFNVNSVYGDIRSEGGVLNEKGIQWCEEEFARYDAMGEPLFLKNNHYTIEARACANLFKDSLWDYQGQDRVEKLIERSKFYVLAEIEESKEEAKKLVDDPTPTEVDPTLLAIEQWKSGEISKEELEKKLDELGWSSQQIDELEKTKPVSEEEMQELEDEKNDESIITVVPKKQEDEKTVTADEGGGCLIATAVFGSEISPQVQNLREIRDAVLLNTKSGTAFMTGFNQIYYLFSPTIADFERENSAFKELVKVTITPLLTTLSILNYVEIDSEAEMLGYGISIISLNVGMYFLIPTLLIIKLKRRKTKFTL